MIRWLVPYWFRVRFAGLKVLDDYAEYVMTVDQILPTAAEYWHVQPCDVHLWLRRH